MTAAAVNKPLVINADFESPGDGTLTVVSGEVVTSNKSDIVITAWDIDLSGSITAGTMQLTLHGSSVGQTLALGGVPKDMHISDAELGRTTALGDYTFGSPSTGDITVSGIEDASSGRPSPATRAICM